jgi:hypothetical protein
VFRWSDPGSGLPHRELPATPDLATPTALKHVPVDAIRRRHILVAHLVGDVLLVSARGEQRRDARVTQRVRCHLFADSRKPRVSPLPVRLLERGRDHVLGDGVAGPALASCVEERGLPRLPSVTASRLVCGEFLLQVVVDIDAAYAGWRLRIEDT